MAHKQFGANRPFLPGRTSRITCEETRELSDVLAQNPGQLTSEQIAGLLEHHRTCGKCQFQL